VLHIILNDLVNIYENNLLIFDACNSVTRSHGLKLRAVIKPQCITALFSYGYRVAKFWNGLSSNTVWAPTLSCFNKHLNDENLSESLLLKFDTF